MIAEGSKGVARFIISLPGELAEQLARMSEEKGYDNRSLAIADMVRDLDDRRSGLRLRFRLLCHRAECARMRLGHFFFRAMKIPWAILPA
jgi:hypothetical protein